MDTGRHGNPKCTHQKTKARTNRARAWLSARERGRISLYRVTRFLSLRAALRYTTPPPRVLNNDSLAGRGRPRHKKKTNFRLKKEEVKSRDRLREGARIYTRVGVHLSIITLREEKREPSVRGAARRRAALFPRTNVSATLVAFSGAGQRTCGRSASPRGRPRRLLVVVGSSCAQQAPTQMRPRPAQRQMQPAQAWFLNGAFASVNKIESSAGEQSDGGCVAVSAICPK